MIEYTKLSRVDDVITTGTLGKTKLQTNSDALGFAIWTCAFNNPSACFVTVIGNQQAKLIVYLKLLSYRT